MRSFSSILSPLVLFVGQACGQALTTNAPPATNSEALAVQTEVERAWSFSASVYTYIVPGDQDYAQPTVTLDRDWLHLESRYNYEDLKTGSLWVGYNFSVGNTVLLAFTPMLGGVFGDTTGLAPGYKATLSWWKLELYSESEFVFVTGDSSGSFYYNWSELTLAPLDWVRFGLVTQRTRAYEDDRDIQRGFLVGFSFKRLDVTTYVFNPDDSNPTVVVGVALTF